MNTPATLGLIAGNGVYPRLVIEGARAAGVERVVMAAFTGETNPAVAARADEVEWLRVGQLGKLLNYFRTAGVTEAMMAGQIAPRNLFDLRPDVRALVMLAKLRQRNAESIFAAIGDELARAGVTLLSATTFLERDLAAAGVLTGRQLKRRERDDVEFGFSIAREVSRLDIGQTVVVKNGTVLAVEAFEGTSEAIKRGGALGRGGATVVKVSKANQDMRFDVPVIGIETIRVAAEAQISVIAVEAGRTLILEREATLAAAVAAGITIVGR